MIFNWSDHKANYPLAIQTLKEATGFTYEPAYGTLFKDGKAITYPEVEGFFDEQGWFLTLYPTEFPGWNGIITDGNGKQIFNDPSSFSLVKSRNHGKALLCGVAIMYFEDMLKTMLATKKSPLRLKYSDLNEQGKDKGVEEIQIDDITLDAKGLVTYSDNAIIDLHDGKSKFLKVKSKGFPFPGLIFNTADFPPKDIAQLDVLEEGQDEATNA
jgi:hypothetical protein